jgi:hypothetical protein
LDDEKAALDAAVILPITQSELFQGGAKSDSWFLFFGVSI